MRTHLSRMSESQQDMRPRSWARLIPMFGAPHRTGSVPEAGRQRPVEASFFGGMSPWRWRTYRPPSRDQWRRRLLAGPFFPIGLLSMAGQRRRTDKQWVVAKGPRTLGASQEWNAPWRRGHLFSIVFHGADRRLVNSIRRLDNGSSTKERPQTVMLKPGDRAAISLILDRAKSKKIRFATIRKLRGSDVVRGLLSLPSRSLKWSRNLLERGGRHEKARNRHRSVGGMRVAPALSPLRAQDALRRPAHLRAIVWSRHHVSHCEQSGRRSLTFTRAGCNDPPIPASLLPRRRMGRRSKEDVLVTFVPFLRQGWNVV